MSKKLIQVLIRTTSYKGYGSGHLKRSILLTNKINETYGNEVNVIIAIEGDIKSIDIIIKSNIKYIALPIGVNLKEELEAFPKNINIVILDVFDRNNTNEKTYKNIADYLVVFSDMGEASPYSDILICPQLLPEEIQKNHEDQIVLEGPDFFIFNDRYLESAKNKIFNEENYNIFVCLGGYSDDKALSDICVALSKNINIISEIIFITGYNCSININTIIKNNNNKIKIFEYCDDPLKYLSQADFAIISGGHIKYEAAALGVPSIIIGLVEHQNILSAIFEKTGVCIYLGLANSISHQDILDGVDKLTLNHNRLKSMGESSVNVVDGLGATRVVNSIFSFY